MGQRALITGVGGQDGSYLAELLCSKGYTVSGTVRPGGDLANLAAVRDSVSLREVELSQPVDWHALIDSTSPDEVYHLGGPSFVAVPPSASSATLRAIAFTSQSLLAAVTEARPACRVFFAGSSEMFGAVATSPQNEDTPLRPRSVHGLAKVWAHTALRYYRDNRELFACTGYLYNHESSRRREEFVTRKITAAAARIQCGLGHDLALGSLDAARDWGYAPEYVEAMWRMLQADEPEDFVIASGVTHTVAQLAETAFAHVGLDYRDHLVVDPTLVRPPEANPLCGDPRRIESRLGWRAEKRFADIIAEMVESDLAHQGAGTQAYERSAS